LATCVNYAKHDMLNTLGFDTTDLSDHALAKAPVEAHFQKVRCLAVGMIRDLASWARRDSAYEGILQNV
jgi:hypothetical protein